MSYHIIKGLKSTHTGRPPKRSRLDDLIVLAKTMEVGDAVNLRGGDAQTFRIILATMGFSCVTDGYNAHAAKGHTLAFKLSKDKNPDDEHWRLV